MKRSWAALWPDLALLLSMETPFYRKFTICMEKIVVSKFWQWGIATWSKNGNKDHFFSCYCIISSFLLIIDPPLKAQFNFHLQTIARGCLKTFCFSLWKHHFANCSQFIWKTSYFENSGSGLTVNEERMAASSTPTLGLAAYRVVSWLFILHLKLTAISFAKMLK